MFTSILPRLRRTGFALGTAFSLTLLVAVSLYHLHHQLPATTGDEVTEAHPHYLPYLNYRAGLERPARITVTSEFSVGIGAVGPFAARNWLTMSNVVANEFNVLMVSPFHNGVHPCPPRWMIDPFYTPTAYIEMQDHNLKVFNSINVSTSPCYELLQAAIDSETSTDPDWLTYTQRTTNWYGPDLAIAWAKRERERGHPISVHINPIIWDHEGTSPHWFYGDTMAAGAGYESWTREEHRTALQLMKEYIEETITRYCSDTIFNYSYNYDDPTNVPHPFNGTNLNGLVSVIEVVNEPTLGDGNVRQINGTFPYAWAIVNALVYSPTLDTGGYGGGALYDSALFHAYNPDFPNLQREFTDYYIYQAFKYANDTITTECSGASEIMPKLSLNTHSRVDLLIEDVDISYRDNDWARGTIDLIGRVNLGTGYIDGLGIQTHLEFRPNEPTPTPGATPATGPVPTNDGSARGLRSILVAADAADLEVRITELDVQMKRYRPASDPNEHFTPATAVAYFPAQADVYRDVFYQCLYDENGNFVPICKEVTMWGLFDGSDCHYRTLFLPHGLNPVCSTVLPTYTPGAPPLGPTSTATSDNFLLAAPIKTYEPKPAHQKVYSLLQKAPSPLPPPTPNGAYPAPPRIPTPLPTANPYP